MDNLTKIRNYFWQASLFYLDEFIIKEDLLHFLNEQKSKYYKEIECEIKQLNKIKQLIAKYLVLSCDVEIKKDINPFYLCSEDIICPNHTYSVTDCEIKFIAQLQKYCYIHRINSCGCIQLPTR